jgi:uncharacterized membrane-anchored protein YhcB (DUF1043 family)
MDVNAQFLIAFIAGIIFTYIIVLFASRHANDKLEKKMDEVLEELRNRK